MITGLRATVDDLMDQTQLSNALAEILKVVSRANKYIDETTPWTLAKDEANKARLATVLYNLLAVSYTHLGCVVRSHYVFHADLF